MIQTRVPRWIKHWFPHLVWDLSPDEKNVYLTFDDGPTAQVTDQLLSLLGNSGTPATFFCLGSKVEVQPGLFGKLKAQGHAIGSHGYNHLNGFRTPLKTYTENALRSIDLIHTNLFRPPYGRITPPQIKKLLPRVHIVMWSIMSMDFDLHTSGDKCLKNVTGNLYPGAVIVFHDTEKASKNLFYVLPRLLEYFDENKYIPKPVILP